MQKPPSQGTVEQNTLSGRRFLRRYIHEQKTVLWLAVLAGSVATVLMLVQWVSFSFMAEKIIVSETSIQDYYSLLAVFGAAVLGQSLFIRLQTHWAQAASLKIRSSIREAMLKQWRCLSPVELKTASAGALASQWIEEVEAMDGYFSRYWPQQMLALISPLLILGTVTYLNWLCGLLLAISAPLIPLFMVLVGMGAEKLNQKYSTTRQRLSGHFLDRVANLSTVRLLGAQQEVFEEVNARSHHYRRVIMKTLKVAFLSSTVLEFFTSVAIASLAIYIGFSLYGAITWGPADSLSLFTGLTILILAPEFFQPLRNLSQYYHDRAGALGAAANLVNLFNVPQSQASIKASAHNADASLSPCANTQDLGACSLDMHDVSIGYEQGKALTAPFNFCLKTGEMLVVSGSSGCGKTTLLNTIAGYIPALSGAMQILPSQHISIAYLPQKHWIKNDTIYNNLAALAPNATRAQMLEVLGALGLTAELAHSHNGLDAVIGEHGQGLSGGQMQRIALARVLLNRASVVLLDEPTAKLDLHSKQFIVSALQSLKSKVIVIAVTHDPSLLNIADMHINLNERAVSEHETLV